MLGTWTGRRPARGTRVELRGRTSPAWWRPCGGYGGRVRERRPMTRCRRFPRTWPLGPRRSRPPR